MNDPQAQPVASDLTGILSNYGARVQAELQDNLELANHNASGKLSSSIRFRVKNFKDIRWFELYMEDYWKWVDSGRKPGKMPPVQNILAWLDAKRISVTAYGYGKNKAVGRKSIISTDLYKTRAKAWAIAKHIAKYGTKPTHFYSDTMKPGHSGDISTLELELSAMLERDVKVVIAEVNTKE